MVLRRLCTRYLPYIQCHYFSHSFCAQPFHWRNRRRHCCSDMSFMVNFIWLPGISIVLVKCWILYSLVSYWWDLTLAICMLYVFIFCLYLVSACSCVQFFCQNADTWDLEWWNNKQCLLTLNIFYRLGERNYQYIQNMKFLHLFYLCFRR